MLYQAEIRDVLPLEAFAARRNSGWVLQAPSDEEIPEEEPQDEPQEEAVTYAEEIVRGVQENHAPIDELIVRYADRWAIERMPVVDRTIVRMAIYELLWREDIPTPVAINEAVELAKSLSTEDSGRFVNGILGRIAEKEAMIDGEQG